MLLLEHDWHLFGGGYNGYEQFDAAINEKLFLLIIIEAHVYDVYVDEFSTPLFRDLDEAIRDDFFTESTKIMTLGLLIEDLVEEPSEGKMDIESFADERCFLELGKEDKSVSLNIDASMVAEDLAKVLEKNGVIKVKGDTLKWKS